MSALDIQSFLRFLSQDAKVPLATAMSKIKELQKANLDSADKLSKAKAEDIKPMFIEDKICKQIIAAAKRVSKKRAAGDDNSLKPSNNKRSKKAPLQLFSEEDPNSPAKLESSIALPTCELAEDALANTVLFTNRAPLVLAFVVILLKYTMPNQPLSSRLSLAQAYVSITSRSRAVNLGIESGKSAEEEGFGEGQPFVTIMGKEIRVLKRWGYEWEKESGPNDGSKLEHSEQQNEFPDREPKVKDQKDGDLLDDEPALWGLDLEAFKKSEMGGGQKITNSSSQSTMPIYTPQSARNYILKAFDTPPSSASEPAKKVSAAAKAEIKEQNLGKLLRVLDLVYASWADFLTPDELDKRTWAWYVKVRPDVENGVAGWGGKNMVKLADILALRRQV